ncbi:HYC_CC_PP family protein [Ulvibacterium sp.]|uniref:HYC_CC_PP family protein n=1 Tax=Ulvibacterium sp. TaxID=2665914 RepID=UPI003BAC43D5
MKAIIYKGVSLAMALLLLVSTTSWTVGKHYCMDRLIDVSFFAHAQDCGMDMGVSMNATSQMETEDSCCSDQLIVVEGQDHLTTSSNDSILVPQPFLTAFAYSYLALFKAQVERPVPHEHYPPPLLYKDIHVLDQVFLI